jgi:hypothetical protein
MCKSQLIYSYQFYVSKEEYENACNAAGQFQEEIKEAKEYIRHL